MKPLIYLWTAVFSTLITVAMSQMVSLDPVSEEDEDYKDLFKRMLSNVNDNKKEIKVPPMKATKRTTTTSKPKPNTGNNQNKPIAMDRKENYPDARSRTKTSQQGRTVSRGRTLQQRGRALQRTQKAPQRGRALQRTQKAPQRGRALQRTQKASQRGRGLQRTQTAPQRGRALQRTQKAPQPGRALQRTQKASQRGRGLQRTQTAPQRGRALQRTPTLQQRGQSLGSQQGRSLPQGRALPSKNGPSRTGPSKPKQSGRTMMQGGGWAGQRIKGRTFGRGRSFDGNSTQPEEFVENPEGIDGGLKPETLPAEIDEKPEWANGGLNPETLPAEIDEKPEWTDGVLKQQTGPVESVQNPEWADSGLKPVTLPAEIDWKPEWANDGGSPNQPLDSNRNTGPAGTDTQGVNLDISLGLAEQLCLNQDHLESTGTPGGQSTSDKYKVKPGTACHVFKWTSCPTNGPEGRPCGWYTLQPC